MLERIALDRRHNGSGLFPIRYPIGWRQSFGRDLRFTTGATPTFALAMVLMPVGPDSTGTSTPSDPASVVRTKLPRIRLARRGADEFLGSACPARSLRVPDAFYRGLVDVPQGTRIRCYADSSRDRFR